MLDTATAQSWAGQHQAQRLYLEPGGPIPLAFAAPAELSGIPAASRQQPMEQSERLFGC